MSTVKLYVYDLSRGLAKSFAPMFLGRQMEGIWHTAIVVYGNEYFFGNNGIAFCPPGGTILQQPLKVVDLGYTEIPKEVLDELLVELNQDRFNGQKYSLFHHNCNTFSNELSQFLTGRPIPEYITSMPSEIMSTPFGGQLEQVISGMQQQLNNPQLYQYSPIGSAPQQHQPQPQPTQSSHLPGHIRFSEPPPDFPAPASNVEPEESMNLQWLDEVGCGASADQANVEARLSALIQQTGVSSGTGGVLATPQTAGRFVAALERLLDAGGDASHRLLELAGRVACNVTGDLVGSGGVPPARLVGCARRLLATGGRPGLPEAGGALALNLILLQPGNETVAFDLGCLITDRLQALAASGASVAVQLTLARALCAASRDCDQLVQLAAVQGVSLGQLASLCPHVARLHESVSQMQQGSMH